MNDDMKPAPFAKGSWQHAVDDALVGYQRTSQEFATPHDAVAWLLKTTANAAIACAAPAPQEPKRVPDDEIDRLARRHFGGDGPAHHKERAFARSVEAAALAASPAAPQPEAPALSDRKAFESFYAAHTKRTGFPPSALDAWQARAALSEVNA